MIIFLSDFDVVKSFQTSLTGEVTRNHISGNFLKTKVIIEDYDYNVDLRNSLNDD